MGCSSNKGTKAGKNPENISRRMTRTTRNNHPGNILKERKEDASESFGPNDFFHVFGRSTNMLTQVFKFVQRTPGAQPSRP